MNELIKLRRETGGPEPRRMGNPGRGELYDVADLVRERIAGKGDLTLDAPVIELREHKGVTAHRPGVGRLLHRLGLSHKKDLHAAEQARPDVARIRRDREVFRRPFMCNHPERPAFIPFRRLLHNRLSGRGMRPG